MSVTGLLRVARNVSNLAQMQSFYMQALGFTPLGPAAQNPALANLLGVGGVVSLHLGLGAQQLELTQCSPPGAPYPPAAQSNDIFFQHIAIITQDITEAFRRAMRAGAVPISTGGPQRLPASSGGVTAWKFRDPEGHPLEFLQFSTGTKSSATGYDHSAICVVDAGCSVAFYTKLGLQARHQQLNQGAEQDGLDGLAQVRVEVVAMAPPDAPPHVELLAYHEPGARTQLRPNDIAADRLVFGRTDGLHRLAQDPDGHFLLLEPTLP